VLGRMLALGLRDGRVMLVDEATGDVKWAVQAHAGENSSTKVAMSPCGRYVASVSTAEENWKLWDAASGAERMAGARHDGTGACICEVTGGGRISLDAGCPALAHTAGLHTLYFTPSGYGLLSAGTDLTILKWDAQTGLATKLVLRLGETTGTPLRPWEEDGVYWMQRSPVKHSTILVSIAGNQVKLWDENSGDKILSFPGRTFAEFSLDGRTIATASANSRDVLLVELDTGTVRLTLVGHQDRVSAVGFSVDDGSKLASTSFDGTCKVWDSSTGALLCTIDVGASICSLAWGPDWVRVTQTCVAFAMGHHPRLGERSEVWALDEGVVRLILDRV